MLASLTAHTGTQCRPATNSISLTGNPAWRTASRRSIPLTRIPGHSTVPRVRRIPPDSVSAYRPSRPKAFPCSTPRCLPPSTRMAFRTLHAILVAHGHRPCRLLLGSTRRRLLCWALKTIALRRPSSLCIAPLLVVANTYLQLSQRLRHPRRQQMDTLGSGRCIRAAMLSPSS
jgi:hypothetical protein